MIRTALIFIGCFIVGALIALTLRAKMHDPHPAPAGEPAPQTLPAPATPGHDGHQAPAPAPHHGHDHGAHAPAAGSSTSASVTNTVCPGCGMGVDPDLKPVVVGGTPIGIGCAACVARITADPERHLEAAKQNRKATK